jgi:hypothetical protein
VLRLNADGTVKSSQKIAHSVGGGPILANNDNFGSAVASLGDLDGDGAPDLAIGAEADDTGGNARGAIYLLFFNTPPGISGDYNDDGSVDAADYATWRKLRGQAVTLPNDTSPGSVNQEDYDVWRANFGRTIVPGSSASACDDSSLPQTLLRDEDGTDEVRTEAAGSTVVVPPGEARRPTALPWPHGHRPAFRNPRPAGDLPDDALVAWLAANSALQHSVRSFNNFGDFEIEPIHHKHAVDDALDVAFSAFG